MRAWGLFSGGEKIQCGSIPVDSEKRPKTLFAVRTQFNEDHSYMLLPSRCDLGSEIWRLTALLGLSHQGKSINKMSFNNEISFDSRNNINSKNWSRSQPPIYGLRCRPPISRTTPERRPRVRWYISPAFVESPFVLTDVIEKEQTM